MAAMYTCIFTVIQVHFLTPSQECQSELKEVQLITRDKKYFKYST